MVQQFAAGKKGQPDVIYYRNKRGWITWGDTQASKQIDMINGKGCTPLSQYGKISYSEDLWGPILRHPNGPAEFPVEQILAYRWYRKDRLPDLRPIVQQGREWVRMDIPQPKVRFPQLAGVKITEYPCPENCRTKEGDDLSYHDPLHLGSHLRIRHEYDRSEILKYGDAMGIDFTKVPGGKKLVEFDFDEELEQAVAEVEEDAPEFEMVTVSAETPVRHDCPDCGWENVKNTEQGLAVHKRLHCKAQAVPA